MLMEKISYEENTVLNLLKNFLNKNIGLPNNEIKHHLASFFQISDDSKKPFIDIINISIEECISKCYDYKTNFNFEQKAAIALSEHQEDFINIYIKNLKDEIDFFKIEPSLIIDPKLPFSNIEHIETLFESFDGEIIWLDKHFRTGSLHFINYFTNVSKLKLLIGSKNIINVDTKKINDEFKMKSSSLKKEWKSKDKDLIIKIITDGKLESEIHDRMLISDKIGCVLPPSNIIEKKFGMIIHISPKQIPIIKDFIIKRYWECSSTIENYKPIL